MLSIAAWRLRFTARGRGRLPSYPGSAWRGTFGRTLRSTVCVHPETQCVVCHQRSNCVYPALFESPLGKAGRPPGLQHARPNPYILRPAWLEPIVLEAGDITDLRVVLFGRAIASASLVHLALQKAGLQGVGPDRTTFDLAAVEPIDLSLPPIPPEAIQISFETPLRIAERNAVVRHQALEPRHILGGAVRRVSLLVRAHEDHPVEADYKALRALASAARFIRRDVRWEDWVRYSDRQHRQIRMGGVRGSVVLPMADLMPFWDFLRLTPWTHIGKGAVMGLGAVRIELVGGRID